ncbi:phosphotransferase family protein [Micromonospora sp. NPDC050397]|uniref:phosphotransferase family protein n=1 Tax=Micromonospora sp. NPDC050397 TaxID=3364279 RepID=UPI00384C6E13
MTAQDDPGRQGHSLSGSDARPVRTATGRNAYLKTTPAGLGPAAVAAARRELTFYREVAARVSVRTPSLLAWHDSGDGVAVLLTSSGHPVEPRRWSPTMWTALGHQLALLHGAPPPPGSDWFRPDPLLAAIAAPDAGRVAACWADTIPELPGILARTEDLLSDLNLLEPVLTHGDCHTDNVAFLDQQPALYDWQSVVVGRPAADIAFLSVRATPSGITVPPDLVAAYRSHTGYDRDNLRRALLAEELAIFLFLWPPFAALNTATGVAHARRRVRSLATRWLRATTDEKVP